MSAVPTKRPIAIVTACMKANGTPDFALTTVQVTPEQAAEGVHYALADARLLQDGYEEPFVHFDAAEAPSFLHSAVRHYLGQAPDANDLTIPLVVEKR